MQQNRFQFQFFMLHSGRHRGKQKDTSVYIYIYMVCYWTMIQYSTGLYWLQIVHRLSSVNYWHLYLRTATCAWKNKLPAHTHDRRTTLSSFPWSIFFGMANYPSQSQSKHPFFRNSELQMRPFLPLSKRSRCGTIEVNRTCRQNSSILRNEHGH